VNARIDSAQIVLEDVQAEAHVIAYLDDVRVIALEGVMNFSPYTIASGHGYSKTIPQ
jgi:hypothetical protein